MIVGQLPIKLKMDSCSKKLTVLDNFIFSKFTRRTHKIVGKRNRLVFPCIYNHGENPKCDAIVYGHSLFEINSFFNHLQLEHSVEFSQEMLNYFEQNNISDISEISCIPQIRDMKCILHFRCYNHLLNLALDDWIHLNSEMTDFKKCLNNIYSVFKKQKFSKLLNKKIPSIGQTRWNSDFLIIQRIFEQRQEIIEFYKNPQKKK